MLSTEPLTHQLAPLPHSGRDDVLPGLPPPPLLPGRPNRETRRKLKRLKVADLMTTAFPPQKFVVAGILRVGLSMLAGAPKLGKSWASLDLALSVATGRPFLNQPTDQGAVLYLALEDSPRRLQERLNRIGPGVDWETLPLELWTETEAIDAGGLDALQHWLEHADQPRLIVIDVWARFDSHGLSPKNEYDRITQTMQPLQALATEFQVAILLVHHTRKSMGEASMSSDPFDQVMGSRALTSNMDQTMLLTRTRMQQDAVLAMTGRDIEESQINLSFDKASCQWQVTDHASGPVLSPERQLVLDAVGKGFLKAATIADHLGKGRTSVANHLGDLVKDGHLRRLAGGVYAVPNLATDLDPDGADPADMTDTGDMDDSSFSDPLI